MIIIAAIINSYPTFIIASITIITAAQVVKNTSSDNDNRTLEK